MEYDAYETSLQEIDEIEIEANLEKTYLENIYKIGEIMERPLKLSDKE